MAKLTFKPGNDEIIINTSGELPEVGAITLIKTVSCELIGF